VVADEVRKLAERTTTATKEIAEMIKSIQSGTSGAAKAMENASLQVEQGVASTERAGESLQQIIQMSEQVGAMITDIATGASQQSSANCGNQSQYGSDCRPGKRIDCGLAGVRESLSLLVGPGFRLAKHGGQLQAGSENRRSSGGGHQIRSSSHRKEGSPSPKEESKAFAAAPR
jgi:hypothetical protein